MPRCYVMLENKNAKTWREEIINLQESLTQENKDLLKEVSTKENAKLLVQSDGKIYILTSQLTTFIN